MITTAKSLPIEVDGPADPVVPAEAVDLIAELLLAVAEGADPSDSDGSQEDGGG